MDDNALTSEDNKAVKDIIEKAAPFSYLTRYSCKECNIKYQVRNLPVHHMEVDMSCVRNDANYICKKIAMY